MQTFRSAPQSKDLSSVSDAEFQRAQFCALSGRLAEIICKHGYEATPYRSPGLPVFTKMPDAEKNAALLELSKYLALCEQTLSQGGDLNSSSTFAWRALRESGLVPPSDLFSKIGNTDLVEVYDLQNIQRFRNFRFFKYCSYTIEDLYCRPWQELFIRIDDEITGRMLKVLHRLLESKSRAVTPMGVGPQIIQEVDSVRMRVNELTVKHIAVLYNRDDQPAAFIVIEEVRALASA